MISLIKTVSAFIAGGTVSPTCCTSIGTNVELDACCTGTSSELCTTSLKAIPFYEANSGGDINMMPGGSGYPTKIVWNCKKVCQGIVPISSTSDYSAYYNNVAVRSYYNQSCIDNPFQLCRYVVVFFFCISIKAMVYLRKKHILAVCYRCYI